MAGSQVENGDLISFATYPLCEEQGEHTPSLRGVLQLDRNCSRPARRELLLWAMDLWKHAVHTVVTDWIQLHWRPIQRCHSCHWKGFAPRAVTCPGCGTMSVLSTIVHPRQQCHYCEWTGHPDLAQECPACGNKHCLSLLQVRKLYQG